MLLVIELLTGRVSDKDKSYESRMSDKKLYLSIGYVPKGEEIDYRSDEWDHHRHRLNRIIVDYCLGEGGDGDMVMSLLFEAIKITDKFSIKGVEFVARRGHGHPVSWECISERMSFAAATSVLQSMVSTIVDMSKTLSPAYKIIMEAVNKKLMEAVEPLTKQAADEQLSEKKEEEEKQDLATILKMLKERSTELCAVLDKEHAQEEASRELEEMSDDQRDYYYTFKMQLGCAFVGSQAVHDKAIAVDPKTGSLGSAASAAINLIPGGSLIATIVGKAIDSYGVRERKADATLIVKAFETFIDVPEVIEMLARELTLLRREKIADLSAKEAKEERGVMRKILEKGKKAAHWLKADDINTSIRELADKDCKKILAAIVAGRVFEQGCPTDKTLFVKQLAKVAVEAAIQQDLTHKSKPVGAAPQAGLFAVRARASNVSDSAEPSAHSSTCCALS
jgi:hypothetical protein